MTTNFLGGVANVAESTTLGRYIAPDPTAVHQWFDDFDNFEADQWLITTTEAGTGNATEAIANADGGILVLTNDDADDDADFLQWSGDDASTAIETFRWAASKSMWFKARFKVSNATQSDVVIGLQIIDTTPLDASDGLFFIKSDESTSLTFKAVKDSSASTVTAGTLADDTYVTCGFHWDAEAVRLNVFFNDVRVGSITSTTNMPDDEDLTISFGIQNGSAGAKSLSLDYILCAKSRA